jgi:hypothetical protein
MTRPKALNGPVRAPCLLTRAAPREPTMLSHTSCLAGSGSSRLRYGGHSERQ